MARAVKTPKPPALPVPTEAEVTEQILAACQMLGLQIKRQNVGGAKFANADGSTRYVAFGEAGDPDWVGVMPVTGKMLGLEIKRPGERPRAEQLAKLRRLNEQNGVGLWVDDAEVFLRLFPKVIAGGWIEIDADGTPYACWNTAEDLAKAKETA